ncbi:hypothetical protein DL764_006774 [Monosporascus ibericus]|uniref:Uncharacterized protein n=1 Tax=Monosporascus ibericus TaxID=155417 RepID=A0A4Q4T3V9_9PEZI|nr:hypothetical protein DL764_006774 [Monosporascus ibericus]
MGGLLSSRETDRENPRREAAAIAGALITRRAEYGHEKQRCQELVSTVASAAATALYIHTRATSASFDYAARDALPRNHASVSFGISLPAGSLTARA